MLSPVGKVSKKELQGEDDGVEACEELHKLVDQIPGQLARISRAANDPDDAEEAISEMMGVIVELEWKKRADDIDSYVEAVLNNGGWPIVMHYVFGPVIDPAMEFDPTDLDHLEYAIQLMVQLLISWHMQDDAFLEDRVDFFQQLVNSATGLIDHLMHLMKYVPSAQQLAAVFILDGLEITS